MEMPRWRWLLQEFYRAQLLAGPLPPDYRPDKNDQPESVKCIWCTTKAEGEGVDYEQILAARFPIAADAGALSVLQCKSCAFRWHRQCATNFAINAAGRAAFWDANVCLICRKAGPVISDVLSV